MDKIFFFDIDGTLAFHGKIPEDNIKALKELKELGCKTFICTGRAVSYAKGLFGDLVTGYIACNGRYIEADDAKLYGNNFSVEEMQRYLDIFKKLDIGYMFAGDYKVYIGNMKDELIENIYQSYGKDKTFALEDLSKNYYTFDLFYDKSRFKELCDYFDGELILNNHYNGSCDCTTVSFDKGSAVKYLLDYYHIDVQNSYAFGDGSNDVYMFREAGNKIAMGNALDELKAVSTYITDDFDKEGIRKALQHFEIL